MHVAVGRDRAIEETQDLGRAEVPQPVVNDGRIDLSQGRRALEHQIGGILRLIDAPVITQGERPADLVGQGMTLRHEWLQRERPGDPQLAVGEFLRALGVGDPAKRIVALQVGDAGLVELAGEPEPAVQADHQLERKPRLQPQVHEAPLRVLEVKVVMQAAPFAQVQAGGVRDRVLAQLISQARFEDAEDAHQPVVDLVARGQVAGEFLLGVGARFQITQRPALGGRERGGRRTNSLGKPADEAGELPHLHARFTEVTEHERGLIQVTQAAAQPDPVIATDYARDIGPMRCQESVEPPIRMRRCFRFHPPTLIASPRSRHFRLRRQPRSIVSQRPTCQR